jgi:hypothetical protein
MVDDRPGVLRLRSSVAASWTAALTCACLLSHAGCGALFSRSTIPRAFSDEEFWRLSSELSEPAGVFAHSDNLVSNEIYFPHTIRRLRSRGGVYVGVGPEQNFSYIARLRPALAFIVDIRRENLDLHLLYKALFELSADRADFVSRLFSRDRPSGLDTTTSVAAMFDAYARVQPNPLLYDRTLQLVRERLVSDHRFALATEDIESIGQTLHAFYTDGPDIHYGRALASDSARPTYRSLMTAADATATPRSYLATEDAFSFVQELHSRNAIVPVVGDFSGPHALRQIGDYIRQHHDVVQAFYGSNVEVYLNRARAVAFCANLATLPYASTASFIDNKGMHTVRAKLRSCVPPSPARP